MFLVSITKLFPVHSGMLLRLLQVRFGIYWIETGKAPCFTQNVRDSQGILFLKNVYEPRYSSFNEFSLRGEVKKGHLFWKRSQLFFTIMNGSMTTYGKKQNVNP